MTQAQGSIRGTVQTLTGVENQLSDTLLATSDEVAHSECLDEEDRAEVYAILGAIRSDSKAHRQTIKLLSRELGEAGHA